MTLLSSTGNVPAAVRFNTQYMTIGQPPSLDFVPGTSPLSVFLVFNSEGYGNILSKATTAVKQVWTLVETGGHFECQFGGGSYLSPEVVLNSSLLVSGTLSSRLRKIVLTY